MVTAGLQSHVGGGAGSLLTGMLQGMYLGMRLTDTFMPALTDDITCLYQQAADAWIWIGACQATFCKTQGTRHVQLVGCRIHVLAGECNSK